MTSTEDLTTCLQDFEPEIQGLNKAIRALIGHFTETKADTTEAQNWVGTLGECQLSAEALAAELDTSDTLTAALADEIEDWIQKVWKTLKKIRQTVGEATDYGDPTPINVVAAEVTKVECQMGRICVCLMSLRTDAGVLEVVSSIESTGQRFSQDLLTASRNVTVALTETCSTIANAVASFQPGETLLSPAPDGVVGDRKPDPFARQLGRAMPLSATDKIDANFIGELSKSLNQKLRPVAGGFELVGGTNIAASTASGTFSGSGRQKALRGELETYATALRDTAIKIGSRLRAPDAMAIGDHRSRLTMLLEELPTLAEAEGGPIPDQLDDAADQIGVEWSALRAEVGVIESGAASDTRTLEVAEEEEIIADVTLGSGYLKSIRSAIYIWRREQDQAGSVLLGRMLQYHRVVLENLTQLEAAFNGAEIQRFGRFGITLVGGGSVQHAIDWGRDAAKRYIDELADADLRVSVLQALVKTNQRLRDRFQEIRGLDITANRLGTARIMRALNELIETFDFIISSAEAYLGEDAGLTEASKA